MSELIADLFISVDGYAKGSRSPAYFGFGGPDLDRWIGDQMKRPQRHLMGRETYEALAALPEPAHDEGSLSLAATPTTVFSRTWGPFRGRGRRSATTSRVPSAG